MNNILCVLCILFSIVQVHAGSNMPRLLSHVNYILDHHHVSRYDYTMLTRIKAAIEITDIQSCAADSIPALTHEGIARRNIIYRTIVEQIHRRSSITGQ